MNTLYGTNRQLELFKDIFISIKDPRRVSRGNFKYPLIEVIFLTISATVSGCNTYEVISEFGEEKIHWLRKYFPYKNGIPLHDTLSSIFSVLDSKEFSKYFKKFT